MNLEPTQWEMIFRRDGHVYPEPVPTVIRFAEMLAERGLHSVLDLGCGNGRHTVYAAQKGFRATGMDNSPTALRLSHEWLTRERLKADLALADMRYPFPFMERSFDAVISVQVIHHARLATVIGTANEITRITRPGGLILLSVPLRKAVEEDALQHEEVEPNTLIPLDGDEKGLPHHLFSPDEFRGIFPEFNVIDLSIVIEKIIVLTAIKK